MDTTLDESCELQNPYYQLSVTLIISSQLAVAQTRPTQNISTQMSDLNQTLIDDPKNEDEQIVTPDKKQNKEDETSFPCDKCERIFPKKQARALHLSRTHNIKTINYTPGIVRQNSKKHMEIRLSLKCTLCNFISKSKPTLKKHIDIHHKDKMTVDLPEAKKRQHKSYNCPECNLTFDNEFKIEKHLKEHVHGKTLSPE
jgi:hypothetical protein